MVRPGQQVAASGVPVDGANSTLERVLDTLGAAMELLQVPVPAHVRDDIQTRHEPMNLSYLGAADLPRVGIALGRAYLPSAELRDLPRLTISRRS